MIIKYEAYDGKLFSTEEECRTYENEKCKSIVRMYNWRGEPTRNVESALVVYLGRADEDGVADAFIQMGNEQNADVAGIDSDSFDWQYWSEEDERYHYITKDVIDILHKILHNGGEE